MALAKACDNTIGRHGDRLAKLVSKSLRKNADVGAEKDGVKKVAYGACKKTKCNQRKNSVSLEQRSKWTAARAQYNAEHRKKLEANDPDALFEEKWRQSNPDLMDNIEL